MNQNQENTSMGIEKTMHETAIKTSKKKAKKARKNQQLQSQQVSKPQPSQPQQAAIVTLEQSSLKLDGTRSVYVRFEDGTVLLTSASFRSFVGQFIVMVAKEYRTLFPAKAAGFLTDGAMMRLQKVLPMDVSGRQGIFLKKSTENAPIFVDISPKMPVGEAFENFEVIYVRMSEAVSIPVLENDKTSSGVMMTPSKTALTDKKRKQQEDQNDGVKSAPSKKNKKSITDSNPESTKKQKTAKSKSDQIEENITATKKASNKKKKDVEEASPSKAAKTVTKPGVAKTKITSPVEKVVKPKPISVANKKASLKISAEASLATNEEEDVTTDSTPKNLQESTANAIAIPSPVQKTSKVDAKKDEGAILKSKATIAKTKTQAKISPSKEKKSPLVKSTNVSPKLTKKNKAKSKKSDPTAKNDLTSQDQPEETVEDLAINQMESEPQSSQENADDSTHDETEGSTVSSTADADLETSFPANTNTLVNDDTKSNPSESGSGSDSDNSDEEDYSQSLLNDLAGGKPFVVVTPVSGNSKQSKEAVKEDIKHAKSTGKKLTNLGSKAAVSTPFSSLRTNEKFSLTDENLHLQLLKTRKPKKV